MQSSSKKEFPNFHDDEEDLDDNKTKIIEKSPKERFYRVSINKFDKNLLIISFKKKSSMKN